ncbi:hypothetical protein SUDANB5_03015 [Streptomyces sp. SudanB5_2050]
MTPAHAGAGPPARPAPDHRRGAPRTRRRLPVPHRGALDPHGNAPVPVPAHHVPFRAIRELRSPR